MKERTASFIRRSVADAERWIDENALVLPAEEVALGHAVGRILAADVAAAADMPAVSRAAIDGVALRADETAGASAYNPVSFRLSRDVAAAPPPFAAVPVNAGDPMPRCADTVVPLDRLQRDPEGGFEIIEAVAPASGVEAAGSHVRGGATLAPAGRELRLHDFGLLAAAGVTRLIVRRRPRVHCLLLARHGAGSIEANAPLLRATIARDAGIAEIATIGRGRTQIAAALREGDPDIVVTVGGTGRGDADEAAAALGEAGTLALHGIALRPGETAGLGLTSTGAPVVLLPGAPAACLWAYEFLAGRAIRRRGGRRPELPFPMRRLILARKIVSAIGVTEICPVRRVGEDRVEPVTSFAEAGLGALAEADGFVVIPEGSEGIAEAAAASVHLFAP